MGFAASSGRLMMLLSRKSDIEFQVQLIQQARMRIQNVMDRLMLSFNTLDPNDPMVRQSEVLLQRIQLQDKRMEMVAQRLTTQHEAISTEVQAVKKVISKNIQGSFNALG
jgi:hypothetical protein